MKRLAPLGVVLACLLALAGCGGHQATKLQSHQATTVPALHGGRPHAAGFGAPPAGDYGLPNQNLTVTQLIEGYDAVTLANVPRDAAAVGCYVSGPFTNCSQARADFPNARLVTIATFASYQGPAKLLDTEAGDAVPSQDASFIETQIRVYHTYRPGVYADAAEMPEVQADLNAARIPRVDYVLMVADWDGSSAIPAGFDAKQWFSNCCIDRDSFTPAFFGAPPAPKPVAVSFAIYYNAAFPSRWGPLNERLTAEQAAGAEAHPAKYATYLRDVLAPKLEFLADRIAYVAIAEHKGWAGPAEHARGSRFQLLIHDSQKASKA